MIIVEGKPKERTLDDWIAAFMTFTANLPTPPIYREWTAISTIGAALERRVWSKLYGLHLYPNTIILLVGPPAVGKGVSINEAERFLRRTGQFNVAPNGITKAAFVDQLGSKIKVFKYRDENNIKMEQMYNAMIITAPEFGTLLPEYDMRFLNVINDIYDCRDVFEDKVRMREHTDVVDRPHVNIIGGTQPTYLGEVMPEAAYGLGFMSRVIMIYHGERVVKSLFGGTQRSAKLEKTLLTDLLCVANITGEFHWEPEAVELIEEWNIKTDEDAPDHQRLHHYAKRRVGHGAKVAMILAVSRGNELIITAEDVVRGKKLIIQAEGLMPEIFKEMGKTTDSAELDTFHQFIFTYCMKREEELIPERNLVRFIGQRIPVNRVNYFINMMIQNGMMEIGKAAPVGLRQFRPLSKSSHD